VQPRAGRGGGRGGGQAGEEVAGEADRVAVEIGHRGDHCRGGGGGQGHGGAVAGGGDGEQRDQHAGQQQRVEGQQQVGGQDAGQRADWFAVAQQQGQQGFGEGQALPERVRRSPPAPGVEGDPQRAV